MSRGSFRRRRLGRELRRLREEQGLTGEAVAKALDIAPSTLSRIETAAMVIQPKNVRLLLDHYGIGDGKRDALLTLAREAKQQSWWHTYGDVLPDWFEVYVDLEGEADSLSAYDAQMVNGLVQTEDYARALLTASRPEDAQEEIDRRVELRMRRQARLLGGGLRLHLILDECALHRTYGDTNVMTGQVRHILALAELRNVTVQILPGARASAGVVGSFSVLEFGPDDPVVVYVENEVSALYMERPEHVRQYSRLYGRLQAAALDPSSSADHLKGLAVEE